MNVFILTMSCIFGVGFVLGGCLIYLYYEYKNEKEKDNYKFDSCDMKMS